MSSTLKDDLKKDLLLWFINNKCSIGDTMSRKEFTLIVSKYIDGYIDTHNACDDALEELAEDELLLPTNDAVLLITEKGLVFAEALSQHEIVT